jgi:hypothetical protein
VYTPSLLTVVVFHEFCTQNFGVVQRKVPPVRLISASDLGFVGLDEAVPYLPSSPGESLWWQRWGGELFAVSFADLPSDPIFIRRTLSSRVGRFEKLPYRVMR